MKFSVNDTTPVAPHDKHWQFCVGSCHATMAQRVDYAEQLKFVHDELGIKRVRFHGLFNDDMKVGMTLKNVVPLKRADKFREFSFLQIAKVFDNLLSCGVEPFVELGFMPKILASGKRKCAFEYRGNITMPKSLDEWSRFITEFLNFLVDRYGRERVKSWYFEVWNEPNLPVFFAGSQRDYFGLYKATALAVKAVDKDIRVGGPSTANCAWIEDFVQFCKKENVPCDFVSTHQYAGDPLGHVFRVGAMIKSFGARLAAVRRSKGGTVLEGARLLFADESENIQSRDVFTDNLAQILPQTEGIPLYYTEWNVSATCTAPINDTRRAASYAVRTVLSTEGKVAGTSWWTFSDLFEEIQFFTEPFSGAFGLINNYGIPKPSFYAFKLLSLLGNERYVLPDTRGETSANRTPDEETGIEAAAFRKNDLVQFLVYRQNFSAEDGTPRPYELEFEGKRVAGAHVFKIDSTHCNPLSEWQKMGSPKYLKPNEVTSIIASSSLQKEEINTEFENGKTIVRGSLCNNDVHLVELQLVK